MKSQKELAKALGVTPARVSQLKAAGRIEPGADGLWDVEAVRMRIAHTADLAQSMAAETRARARAGEVELLPVIQPDDGAMGEGVFDHYYTEDHAANFKVARSLREREEAAKARTERMLRDSLLVEKADVERAAYTEARVLRDRLMGLPTKVAPLLAPVTDAFECERMLREALRQVLQECLRAVEGGA
ncbi:MAG: hypothetical protein Q7U52_11705 [Hydrogenophaga sp.]|nr:hypothetical protein [Hydrogenophaga sp.]